MRTLAELPAQGQRPAHLHDVDLAELTPELRMIVLHDGTLTRALEACRLRPVAVDVRAEECVPLTRTAAMLLSAPAGSDAVLRRVDILDRNTSALLATADSVLITDRLPDLFFDILPTCRNGLGEALTRLRLECRRELLWVGSSGGEITRAYRVISDGRPVLLVEETFPHDGRRPWRTETW